MDNYDTSLYYYVRDSKDRKFRTGMEGKLWMDEQGVALVTIYR